MKRWRNWSGSVECVPAEYLQPTSLEALCQGVREATARGRTVRPVGSGHSFTPLCASDEVMVSLQGLQGIESLDVEKRQATVWGGTRLKELGPALTEAGLAMENLGDINLQALAGALSTGTHGTGASFGALATQVEALTLVTAKGEVLECSAAQEPEVFRVARVSLGALGVVARVRLRLVPAYRLRLVQRNVSLEECLEGLEAARARHRHYEFFWFPHTRRVLTKAMDVTEQSSPGRGLWRRFEETVLENGLFLAASELCRHRPSLCAPVSRAVSRVALGGEDVGVSHEVFASPRLVRFHEMEYGLPAERGVECFQELEAYVSQHKVQVHFPVEFRFVQGDDIALSPAHGRDSVFIAVHQYQGMPWRPYFEAAESIFRNHGGRPHWGKMHTGSASSLRPLYPAWDDFQEVRERLDPGSHFLNPYLRHLLVG